MPPGDAKLVDSVAHTSSAWESLPDELMSRVVSHLEAGDAPSQEIEVLLGEKPADSSPAATVRLVCTEWCDWSHWTRPRLPSPCVASASLDPLTSC